MLLYNVLNFIFGYTLVSIERGRGCEKILAFLVSQNITFWEVENIQNRTMFKIKPYYQKTLLGTAKEIGLDYRQISIMNMGLPFIFLRHKRRLGIMIGTMLGMFFVVYSTLFVWKIEVIGNQRLTYTQIVQMLSEKGFGEGTFTPGINLKRIETAIMVDNVDVAFISIYLKGTTAVVQVNERKLTSEKENLNLPINLVADYPGQIVNLEVVSGQSVVKRGEAVEKGQLLVSGIIDSNTVGYRIKSASGKVMASTSHDIYYEIPLVQPKKYYTGNENRQKSVKILGKYINFFANSGNLYEKYDTIYNESSITLFDVIQLPVYFVERVYSEYIEKDVEIDVKRARELAYDNYAEFAAGRKSLTIEKENLEEKIENGKFILYGTVECIEDISQEKPFYYIQE